ncbi:trypsin [Folsomia candida]|uniref:trypsin n=1 Tax=Folsomia candida TaxID=158441 RepID=UPI000B8F40F7|nr:trypsin [Folsomia candida]
MKLAISGLILVLMHLQCSVSTNITDLYTNPPYQAKIIGGEVAAEGRFPYQVAIIIGGIGLCGGSLISDREVLTAAHCTKGRKPFQIFVRVGSLDYRSGGETRKVSQIRQHPLFNSITQQNDISMLVLSSPVTLNEMVGVVTLPTEEPSAGAMCETSGWGVTAENGQQSSALRYIELPIIDRETCRQTYSFPGLSGNQICAGLREGGRDACQGDSGGALVLSGTSTQVGIVSYGLGCARPNVPGVYTNLFNYLSWIRSEMQPNTFCASMLDVCNRLQLSLVCKKVQLLCNPNNVSG